MTSHSQIATQRETPARRAETVSGSPSKVFRPDADPSASGVSSLRAARQFVRECHWRIVFLSVVALVPCFWHSHIEAGDLASHTYNAWLAQLIVGGHAPGLWLAHRWSNVLFDEALSVSCATFGFRLAELVCVGLLVLVFFWGAFALASAMACRRAWSASPLLLMLAYGWTFENGLLNYYLSVGLAAALLALFWNGTRLERTASCVLAPFLWLAHPLGFCFFVAVVLYVSVAGLFPQRAQVFSLLLAVATLSAAGRYLVSYFHGYLKEGDLLLYNGADQLILFGDRYRILAGCLLGFAVLCVAVEAMRRYREPEFWRRVSLPAQLYFLSVIAVRVLPSGLLLNGAQSGINLIAERLPLICGVLACSVLMTVRIRVWHFAGYFFAGLAFFAMLHRDTGVISRLETKADQLVLSLPANARVLAALPSFPGARVNADHIVDRACIGHCFSYGNYEAATEDFRVRAKAGNGIVVSASSAAEQIAAGQYVLTESELPAWGIYPCGEASGDLCVRELHADERNGREPPRNGP